MPRIHPTAVVAASAVIADDAQIGAFCVIGADVELGPNVEVGAHASVHGRTRVGAGTRIFPYACLGGEPQTRGPQEPGELEIGRGNVIREFVTIHVGTASGRGCTRIGDDNLIMNNAHIAHDCRVGSHCIITGPGGLAGHVVVEDHAVLGAFAGMHQFTRIGESAMAASGAKLSLDAPPFSLVAGDRARLVGVNMVGLRRRNLSEQTIRQIKHAFHLLFLSKLLFKAAVLRVREEMADSKEVAHLLQFLEASDRGFCR